MFQEWTIRPSILADAAIAPQNAPLSHTIFLFHPQSLSVSRPYMGQFATFARTEFALFCTVSLSAFGCRHSRSFSFLCRAGKLGHSISICLHSLPFRLGLLRASSFLCPLVSLSTFIIICVYWDIFLSISGVTILRHSLVRAFPFIETLLSNSSLLHIH